MHGNIGNDLTTQRDIANDELAHTFKAMVTNFLCVYDKVKLKRIRFLEKCEEARMNPKPKKKKAVDSVAKKSIKKPVIISEDRQIMLIDKLKRVAISSINDLASFIAVLEIEAARIETSDADLMQIAIIEAAGEILPYALKLRSIQALLLSYPREVAVRSKRLSAEFHQTMGMGSA